MNAFIDNYLHDRGKLILICWMEVEREPDMIAYIVVSNNTKVVNCTCRIAELTYVTGCKQGLLIFVAGNCLNCLL